MILINYLIIYLKTPMKQLLGMARDKKEKEPPKSSLLQKKPMQPQFEPASQSQPDYDQQQYEMNEEEILGYAQFLGIRLPEEEDLLWIAEEGLCAQLPTGWVAQETEENGQIIYYNTKTKEKTYQHPCDEYYQQLVMQERNKKAGSKILGSKKIAPQTAPQKSFPMSSQPQMMSQPKQIVTDPLLKMQQQKQLRKLEQQKKKEFQEKKSSLLTKHEVKKQELQKELKQKEEKISKKYQEDIKVQKEKQSKKMSEKERQLEQKMNKEIKNYEAQTIAKAQKAIEEKKRKEKQIIDNKMRQKKEEIKKQIQNQLKKAKKDIDNQFKEKVKILEEKQKKTTSDTQQLDNLLQTQIKNLRNQIIRKKMKQHAEKLKQENDRQKDIYNRQIQQMQAAHDQRIAQIQTKQPKNKIKMEQLIKECEKEEEQELQAFRYELEHFKKAKQFQNEEKIQQFRIQLQEQHKKTINQLIKEYDVIYQKYRNLKNQEYESYIWEAERKSKEEYLRSLKALEKKFNTEQEIAIIQNSENANNGFEGQAISKMNSMLDNLNWQEKQQRRQLENIKLQIENLRSQHLSIGGKLNDNQMKLYQLIQDKIKSKPQQSQ